MLHDSLRAAKHSLAGNRCRSAAYHLERAAEHAATFRTLRDVRCAHLRATMDRPVDALHTLDELMERVDA